VVAVDDVIVPPLHPHVTLLHPDSVYVAEPPLQTTEGHSMLKASEEYTFIVTESVLEQPQDELTVNETV
jgi:hypothetical protein